MNQEDIIKLAREAGFDDYEQDEMLMRFATFVAAAVAEPVQEPVAWLDPEENRSDEAFRWGQTEHHIVPLYNHAQRTTLSDDEFISMLDSAGLAVGPELAFEIKEMVEAAHGIKGDA